MNHHVDDNHSIKARSQTHVITQLWLVAAIT